MPFALATEVQPITLKTIPDLHPVLMNNNEYVVLDIETTGFSLDKHAEIIEIGAVKLDVVNKAITGTFSQLIRPSETFSIPKKITDITTITWSQVQDKPYIEEVLPVFSKFLGDTPIVAHNAAFDWPRFLVPAFRTVGLYATNEAVCSMNLAKYLYPGLGKNGYNLAALCMMYGKSVIKGHHRAYVDCKWTASLFMNLLQEYRQNMLGTDAGFDETPLNCLPSKIGIVDFSGLKINRVSFYEGPTKKHGPRIYVYTNFGKLVYSIRRRLWTVTDLWVKENAPAQVWGANVLHKLGMDTENFVKKYGTA